MKKTIIIILSVALILLAIGFWQKNNLEALYLYATKDEKEVSAIIDEERKKLEDEIKKYSEDMPRQLTPDEEKMLENGEMTVEEAIKILLSENEDEEENDSQEEDKTKEDIKSNEPEDAKKPSEGSIVKKYTAEFYSMKAYYIGQLNQIEKRAEKEYMNMTEQQRNNLSKATFVSKYAGYALGLQGECDGKVNELLKKMKEELKKVGGNISIIDTIKEAYENENAARKAYYLNLVG